jgi:AP2 domain
MTYKLPLPSQAELKRLFSYDPATGALTWRVNTGTKNFIGKRAGTPCDYYWRVSINGKLFLASRIIWKWMTGVDPINLIDHCDTNGLNDAWTNLRQADYSQNGSNCRAKARTLKGAYYHDRNGRWLSVVMHKGVRYHLGYFDTEQEAHDAYVIAARKLHGAYHRAR